MRSRVWKPRNFLFLASKFFRCCFHYSDLIYFAKRHMWWRTNNSVIGQRYRRDCRQRLATIDSDTCTMPEPEKTRAGWSLPSVPLCARARCEGLSEVQEFERCFLT